MTLGGLRSNEDGYGSQIWRISFNCKSETDHGCISRSGSIGHCQVLLRQREIKHRPFFDFGFGPNAAAVALDDALNQ